MDKIKDPRLFTRSLLQWFRKNKRDLPWRRTKDPYKIWISEVMLQQTTVKAVLEYYDRWLERFPTLPSLANANINDVLKLWQGLGYYARARNLHLAAQVIIREHDGQLPSEAQHLKKLPGFGDYTSASVASIAFGQAVPLVDANVRRVLQRILGESTPEKNFDKVLLQLLSGIIPARSPGDFNEAMMELGALVCRSKEPSCNVCPLSQFCKAYEQGIQELIPAPKVTRTTSVRAVIAIITKNDHVLIQQRPAKGLLADLWEFPGGKVEPTDHSLATALARELKEELDCVAKVEKSMGRVYHYYTTFKVELNVFTAQVSKDFRLKKHMRWASIEQLHDRYPMPSGSAKIVERFLSNILKT